ncbi:ABC transporter ATP-binding protein, partial [Thermoproteota archaeon]
MGHRMERYAEDDEYERSVPDMVLFKRMISYITSQRRESILLVFAIVASTIINLLPPYMYSLAIDRYIKQMDIRGLYLLGVGFVVVYLLTFGTQYVQQYLINWLGSRLELNMRIDMFKHLQLLSLDFYAKREVGSIVSRGTNDVDKITELITSGVANVIADLLTLVGIIAIMLSMSWWLSLITFSVIPLMMVFLYLWGRKARKVYRETRKTIASVSAKMEESVSGMKEIQSYSREGETRREFRQINRNNMEANVQAGQVMSAFWPIVSVFTAIGNFLVLWYGGSAVMTGTLSIGVLFGFMSYLGRFFWPIEDLSSFWNSVQSSLAAAERVFDIMDTPKGITDKPNATELPRINGLIEYYNLSFKYEDGTPVLKNINLKIKPNTTIALVGPTGVGKTTMINLLYRFYDPQLGAVKVDGHNLRDIKLASHRKQMAVVLQDNFLFSGTVMENIRYGNLNATDEEIIEV